MLKWSLLTFSKQKIPFVCLKWFFNLKFKTQKILSPMKMECLDCSKAKHFFRFLAHWNCALFVLMWIVIQILKYFKYIYVYTHVYIEISPYTHIEIHKPTYTNTKKDGEISMHTYVCICVNTQMCVHIYMWTHIYAHNSHLWNLMGNQISSLRCICFLHSLSQVQQ